MTAPLMKARSIDQNVFYNIYSEINVLDRIIDALLACLPAWRLQPLPILHQVYSKKNYVHEKNIYSTPRAPQISLYVKNNRYMPLYMVVLGLYRVVQGIYGGIWVVYPRYWCSSRWYDLLCLYIVCSLYIALLSIYSMVIICYHCYFIYRLPYGPLSSSVGKTEAIDPPTEICCIHYVPVYTKAVLYVLDIIY